MWNHDPYYREKLPNTTDFPEAVMRQIFASFIGDRDDANTFDTVVFIPQSADEDETDGEVIGFDFRYKLGQEHAAFFQWYDADGHRNPSNDGSIGYIAKLGLDGLVDYHVPASGKTSLEIPLLSALF